MRIITKTELTEFRYCILIVFLLFISSQLPAKPVSAEQAGKTSDTISQNRGLELYSSYYQKNDGQVEVYYDSIEDGNLVGGKVLLALPPVREYQRITQAPPSWNYETVIDSGPSENRIDIVVVGDGYTQSELANYQIHVNNILSGYFAQEPLASYINFFNVHRVDVISAESGVDEPDYNIYRNTALDMSYNCGGTPRLLCIDTTKAWSAASVAPDADQILALANSTRYGGAGYTDLATMAGNNSESVELALHEFGHSFGKLADEYDYGGNTTYTGPEPSQINVSIYNAQQQATLQTKWYRWLYLPNVDTYEGAYYCKYGIYRPTDNSKMRSLDRPFEEVNVEQFIFKIYENVSIIDDSTPLSDEPITDCTDFNVVPVEPTPNTIGIQWYIDGQPVSGANAKTFSADISSVGLHEVSVTVTDNTPKVRNETKRNQLMTKSLQWQVWIGARYNGGTGEPNDPYRIATPQDLNDIGNHKKDWSKYFILVNDVNLAEFTGTQFKIIGTDWDNVFTGVFDGNDHKIYNFNRNSDGIDFIGLFGYVGSGGQIRNLGMENVNVHAGNAWCVGGLVGCNVGTIGSCYSSGSVSGSDIVGGLMGENDGTVTNCHSTGNVSGGRYVGGLVGCNAGTISSCYSSGSVSGDQEVGGLAGDNFVLITNSYSTGSVSGGDWCVGGLVGLNIYSQITNCYSTGSVAGQGDVGGLVGYNEEGIATASFWDTQTSDCNTSAGGTPKTSAEMKTKNTFTDAAWDFVNVWDICEGTNYPRLRWQVQLAISMGDFVCSYGVDFVDFAILASAWQSEPNGPGWNPACDISTPKDDFIDELDLAVFCENWLEGTTP